MAALPRVGQVAVPGGVVLLDPDATLSGALKSLLFRLMRLRHRNPATLDQAVDRAIEQQPAVIGVDVFDTIAVRRLATDAATDHVIANRLVDSAIWSGTPCGFLTSFKEVQKRAPNDFSLQSWLSTMEQHGSFDPNAAEQVFINTEQELLRSVPGASDALDRIRRETSLAFVSDMHLSSKALRDLLAPLGLIESADSIIVSSDAGASKAQGQIFRSDEMTDRGFDGPSAFIGNDLWSDVVQPHSAAISTSPATAGNLTRFERLMASDPTGFGPAIAGAARLQRLAGAIDSDPDAQLRVLGGQVIGQALVAFVAWVRERCVAHDVRNIAFLARDGELPLDMARAMPSDHWDGFELRYLHCGRRSWSLAAAPIVGIDEWVRIGTSDDGAFLLHSATRTPFLNLLSRCGLDLADVPDGRGLDEASPDMPLNETSAAAWKQLLTSGDLNDAIARAAEPLKIAVVTHLRQTGFPNERSALVDVGWRGRQAWLVSALIREATGSEPIHLHFGGDGVSEAIDSMVEIERFAFDDSQRPHPVSSPVACVEMFLASGKRRLSGYRTDEDGVVHEVFEAESSPVDNPDRRALAEGAVELASSMPSRADLERWGLGSQTLDGEARSVLAALWNEPTITEARLLSGLMFEGDDSGGTIGPVIQKYGLRSLVGNEQVPRVWREASLRLTPPFLRHSASAALTLRDRINAVRAA